MSEFDEGDIINGGYQENQGRHWAEKFKDEFPLDDEKRATVDIMRKDL
jgi:hypothetical protein